MGEDLVVANLLKLLLPLWVIWQGLEKTHLNLQRYAGDSHWREPWPQVFLYVGTSHFIRYYLKALHLKMCTCSDIWQKVNSPYGSVWNEKKQSAWRRLHSKTEPQGPKPSSWPCPPTAFLSQTCRSPSPNRVSIFSTEHSLQPDIHPQNEHSKSIFSRSPSNILFNSKMPSWWTTLTHFAT